MIFSDDTVAAISEGIASGRPARGPADLQIIPTTRCNAACVFCPANAVPDRIKSAHARRFSSNRDLAGGLLDRLADDLYRLGGLERLTVTGGEPLLYPHLVPAVFMFKASFPAASLTVVTNGIRLEKFAGYFVAAGLHHLSVSLNAGRPESFLLQNAGAGDDDFAGILRGLSAVAAEKKRTGKTAPHVTVSVVLTRHSIKDVAALYELGKKTGVNAVTFIPLMLFNIGGVAANQGLRAGPADFLRFREEVEEYGGRAASEGFYLGYAGAADDGGVLGSGGLYRSQPCYAGYSFAAVYPNGDVRPCCHCEPVMGNLTEQSFVEIWEGEEYRKMRRKMLDIQNEGPLAGCLCEECGYLYENRLLAKRLG